MQEEPHDCPGTESEVAGQSSACQGCPNQSICSDPNRKSAQNAEQKAMVVEAMKDVRQKLLILSGKGGVGKSTVTMLLTRYFAQLYPARNYGILDVDICGPSQPRLMGVQDEEVHQSGTGWSPVDVEDNICLMSVGFLLESPDNAIIWRGPKKDGMIRQFLSNVEWGALDMLLLDTPPGTSDEHLSIISYLRDENQPDSLKAVIVTTPQEVALLDVRKQINFCRKLNIAIIGVIENMSIFCCGHCGQESSIFPANTGGAKAMCKEMEVTYLGALPLDPTLTKACDEGRDMSTFKSSILEAVASICKLINSTWST